METRNKNSVQVQNARTKQMIWQGAYYWRKKGIPIALHNLLVSYGIDLTGAILLDYEQDYPGTCTDFGTVLTKEKQFFYFEFDSDQGRTKILNLDKWEERTAQYEISSQKKGIGKTIGFLAIEVLKELNKENA